jgi:hypothetical protein
LGHKYRVSQNNQTTLVKSLPKLPVHPSAHIYTFVYYFGNFTRLSCDRVSVFRVAWSFTSFRDVKFCMVRVKRFRLLLIRKFGANICHPCGAGNIWKKIDFVNISPFVILVN